MRFYILITILFFYISTPVFSQSNTIHTVEKGETLYLLSKKYNISLNAIYQSNPQFVNNILQIGDNVTIPNSNQVTENLYTQQNEEGFHTVVTGETKFGLAKKYQTTIANLEADNPEIIPMLMVGQRLRISNKSNTTATSNISNSNDLYVVKPGETLWGLSKRYNISVAEIQNANRDLLVGVLKSGQYLRIPTGSNLNANSNNSENIHIVKAGETKYGLSKKYNLSISELESLNPHIVNMLITGQTVVLSSNRQNQNIPEVEIKKDLNQADSEKTNIEESVENTSNQNDTINSTEEENPNLVQTNDEKQDELSFSGEYEDYEIKSKETLFGLSKKAQMSQEDFLKLNPSLVHDGIKVGAIIKMPKNTSTVENESSNSSNNEKTATNTNAVSVENHHSASQKSDFNNLDKNSSKTVVFLLDYDEEELQSTIATSEAIKTQKEYYQGIKMAIDSIKSLGLNLTPIFLNSNANNKKTNGWKKSFKKGDLILGPFQKENIHEMINFSNEMNLNLVVPVSIEEFATDLKAIYSFPTDQHLKMYMLDYLKSKNGNIIVITDYIDSPEANFIRNYDAQVKFAPLDSKGNLNQDRLKMLFETDRTNFVVLDTDKNSLILSSTNFLLTEANNFSIELALLKERSFLKSNDISDIRYKVLKLQYPSFKTLNANFNDELKSKFAKTYPKEININSVLGFDITIDALLRLFQNKTFESGLIEDYSSQSQVDFSYKKYNGHTWNSAIKINKY